MVRLLKGLIRWWENRESLKLGGAKRSPGWRIVREIHIKKHPNCELCGGTEICEVHHIQSFSRNPELELDPTNLITLCESGKNGIVCHRAFGHLGNYQSINVNCVEDVEMWKEKIQNRP